jgi:hypothetical protein
MLREFERAVLQACCREMRLSKARHVPEHVVIKRFPGAEREARKALKKLVAKGYVGHHPTRGEMTYQLTDMGWKACMEMIL